MQGAGSWSAQENGPAVTVKIASACDSGAEPVRPTVAVLLAAYNGEKWLPEQIASILVQEGVDVTIFVSMDLSTDGTLALLKTCADENSKIKLLDYGDRYGGAAKNFMRLVRDVDFSQFDYVALSDQDDIWLSKKLKRAHEVISQLGASGYSSNVVAFWASGKETLVSKAQAQRRWDFLFEAAGPGCTYVLRKDLVATFKARVIASWDKVQNVGLHDWFIYAFARAHGHRWIIDPTPGMRYRQHAENQVGVNRGWSALRSRSKKIWSGWAMAQSCLIAELVGLQDEPFVQRWVTGRRTGMLSLALHAGQCRRRLRDRILFAVCCLVLAVKGTSKT